MLKPKILLHLEGAAVLAAACFFYTTIHGSWIWFAALFLMPDIALLGYLANLRIGALTYNLAHTYLTPLALMLAFHLAGHSDLTWLSLIWIAHIGFDRLAGYGLKYESSFKETHLQKV